VGLMPPTLLLLAMLLMVLLHLVVSLAEPVPGAWRLAGGILLALGLFLNLAAERAMKSAGTPVRPSARTTTLLTVGVYARTRNPMYLGMLAILAGLGLLLGSLSPWIVPPVFAGLIQVRFVWAEEEKLARAFGTDWQAYASRVRRWL